MDEPVVNCAAQWAPTPLDETSIKAKFPQGERFITLDRGQREKLRFYDLDIALSFVVPGAGAPPYCAMRASDFVEAIGHGGSIT